MCVDVQIQDLRKFLVEFMNFEPLDFNNVGGNWNTL